MTDFKEMLLKAKDMQDKMKEAQEQIKKIEVEGESGGNLVKVVLSGDYELKSIFISEDAKKEDQEIINDLKPLVVSALATSRVPLSTPPLICFKEGKICKTVL